MTECREDMLILKRNPDARYTESYNVLFEGRHVGRIYKVVSHAAREAPQYALAAIFEASPIYQVLPSTKIKSSSEC